MHNEKWFGATGHYLGGEDDLDHESKKEGKDQVLHPAIRAGNKLLVGESAQCNAKYRHQGETGEYGKEE